nr:MAG TPA: nuclease [Caudoviricetes sp.]
MAWTAEKVKAMRESNPAKATESDGWTAEKVRAMRTKTPTATTPKASVATVETTPKQEKTPLYADALDSYRTGGAMARQSPAAKWGKPLSLADARQLPYQGSPWQAGQQHQTAQAVGNAEERALLPLAEGTGSIYGSLAQKQKQYNDQHSQTDEFDAINQWLDTGDNKNLADAVRRVDNTHGVYTDKDLITKGGWTQEQIDTARQMNAALDAIPAWKRGVRRTANTIGGVADTVAAAPFLAGEYAVQAGKNLAQSAANRKALEAEVAKSPREKNLYERLMETDMEYQPKYSTGDLLQQGFTREEIDSMKARIAGTEVQDSVDPEKSLGYQLYHRGQQLNAAAQSGLSPVGRTALGVATSTAENLAVAGVNPTAVLPVLSAQGAAEAMGQSVESGQSAGKALAGGLAKFGAGWAINSVGAADLARTMGSDYAKDTVAGQIADWVRGLAGDGALAKNYPAVANAISGGMDNAMQAFVETYADQAIDAALGDEEAAKTMFSKETFLNALESGLSGGASGALGGAVGTGLAKYNSGDSSLVGQAEYYAAQADAEQAARQQRKALERTMEPGEAAGSSDRALARQNLSVTDGDTSPDRTDSLRPEGYVAERQREDALGMSDNSEQTAMGAMNREVVGPAAEGRVSDNPAVRQFAQVAASDSLTGKTIGLFTPEVGNEANRAAFEAAYGVQLPGTAAATRRMLRSIAAQQQAAQNQETRAADSSSDRALARQDLSGADAPAPLERGALGMSGNSEQTAQVAADAEERALLPRVESVETQNQAVENTGESVESSPAELRETIGLQEAPTENQKMNRVEQKLRSWQVSEKAAENLSKQMPSGLNADTYAAAASSMYRLGQMEDVDTFDKALRLAGSENALGLNVNMVLEKSTGRNVLEQAYLYGKGEQEARAQQMKKLGGALGAQSTSGEGVTYYRGTLRPEDAVASQIIRLNAQGTGTDAVLKSVLNGPDGAPNANVRAYVDTETARIFFGDSAQDVFSTVLHEDYHWYNALDAEGAKTLQDYVLLYLAQKNGYETIDEMIRAKMGDYAAQSLTYEQAAEELVADAWGGIFDSEESVRRWAQFQREQADKNAGRAGSIHKVMQQVKTMLENIISKAKEVLRIDPENTAARKAQRLAEAEKRALQEEYFAHAEKAMDNLRAAKAAENKNAAALKTEDAAEKLGTRFEIDKGFEKAIDELDVNAKVWSKQILVGSTSKVLQSIGVKDQNIYWDSGKIRKILQKHSAENFRAGIDDSIMTREIIKQVPQVLESPIVVLHSDTSRNADYASRIYMFGEVYDQTGKPVDVSLELLPTSRGGLEMDNIVVTSAYGKKNVQGLLNRDEILYIDPNKNRTNTWLAVNRLQLPLRITKYGSIASLRYSDGNVKSVSVENARTDEPVKKTTRFQLASPVEVNETKELVAVHNLTEENLREALDLGGMPSPSIAVVKAQEGHSLYGPISLVFGPDSIDPMANRANRVYGSDAWTPTRPNVEYKVNADQAMKLNTELAQLSRQTAKGAFARGSVLTGTLNMEASSQSPKQLAESLAQNDAVKAAYLADKGEDIQVVTKPEVRFTESQKKRYEKIMEAIGGESVLRDIVETDVVSGNHDRANAVLDEVRQAETAWAMEELGWSEEKAQAKAARLIAPMLRSRLENAYEYVTTKDIAGKLVQDTDAMQQELREKAPDADVASWLLPKMEKILGEKGIYNGKDPYTKQGNRRSFAQLHNPYTLENLVAAMNQEEARGKGAWGLSANTLMSTATAEYKNLDEVRADKGRLQQMPEEEYKALLEKADGQIETILSKLRSETEPHTSNSFEEREILGDILLRAAQGSQTTTAIGKAFAKEGYSISKDTAALIRQLYKDVAAIPTGYFEAKPQRAVGFEEVKAAILPDNASAALVDSLKEHGIAVEQYKAGDEAQRAELLNKVPNVRFQMAESADKDARKNTQRQASRAIAERDASLKTLMDFFGITRGVRISDDSLEGMALRIIKGSGAKGKLHSSEFAKELRPLVEYLKADGADMQKAQSMAEVLAGEVLDHATYRNTELWDQYPELHDLSYTVAKGGQAEAELTRRYGTWGAAVKDARSHGVQLRREAGYRDGNPVEQYESIVNDTRSVGGVKDGAAGLFRTAAKNAGVAGAASMESTEWLEVLMNVHDAIKPRMMSRFADVAEYEDAKVELAGRMLGEVMNLNEMTDVQTIFNGIQKHNREVAAAAAGSEERAAEVLKSLKGVQREQTREFNRRLYENSKAAAQSDEAKAFARQEQKNRAAERLLDQNLDMLGVDISNIGDLNEKLEVLRETYDREWKAEKQRMREERRQMLDDIALERRQLKAENAELARQVAGEQRRADRAERQLIFQENDILEWEQENQRKAEAWQQQQAQQNAIAIEVARQQRDEDIAVAKALAEKRVQKAREGRQKDELRRSIQRNAAQLNQMVLRPAPGKYVQKSLIVQAAEVAKLADLTVMNFKAVQRLEALRTSIQVAQGTEGSASGVSVDWEQSGVVKLIDTLEMDLTATKQAQLDRLNKQMAEARALPDSEKARALQDRLQQRINETENRVYLPMTVDQMRMLKAITASTLHVIRTANKTLSLEKAKEVDAFAQRTAHEVLAAKGNEPGSPRLQKALTLYNLDMLGAKRVFRMLGGYTKDGQMEQLADILNEGQRKQTQITVEGTALFDNVTGKANVKNMEQFAGPGAELVDVGLKDTKGTAVPLTHAQLCSLYMHLKNADSRNHLLAGGLTLPDAKAYHKGDIEAAYQKGQTVQLGSLLNADGTPMADTIVQTVEKAMTDYDRAWCKDMEDFFGRYTTNLINETSMKLLGYQRATVKNYYPIAVDKTQLATQIEGLKLDATIEGRGFLKNRVKSSQPILLEECNNVVQRSLRDTAAYAGLAAPIRDVQKILNSGVETAQGVGILKNKIIKEHWGREAVDYIDYLLTDLQSTQRKRMDGVGRGLGKLRGNYAGAILTLNPGVAIAQAASLPTAGAVLGADTMAAVVPFVKNLSGKQRAALEAEISQHGDVLLRYRMRGSQEGELASIGVDKGLAQNAMDKLPKSLTGWINGMDEITVAALWEGAKRYVEHHADQFDGNAAAKGSDAYWDAVNKMYQRVIEETQPNYTTMQRAGIQRSDNEITKTLTMFTTQRFQNYGILADAVGDYNAQRARYKAEASAANKAELDRAGKQLNRAVASQLTQTAVFALMKIGADFLLHRWDRERDENGDVTAASMGKRFLDLYTESFAGNFLFGSELYTLVGNALNGTDYDVVSATNISAVNDTFAAVSKFITLVKRDTSGMDESELEKYHQKLVKAGMDVLEYGFELLGVPLGNAEKMRQAIMGYWEDAKRLKAGEKLSLNGLPASATGQYDRLYNAIRNGDTEEAAAARAKLEAMGKDDKTIYSQLKTRMKKYDDTIQRAAKAQVAGDDATRRKLTRDMVLGLYETLGIDRTDKADAAKREQVIDLVTGAITDVANAQLKGGRAGLYDDLSDALDSGRVKDVQDELNRLMTAGKEADSLKSKVTELVKPVYLAGNDYDRAQMEAMLLKLEDDSGGKLYERKTFEQWVKQAKKKEEQAEKTTDEWAGLR